MAPTVPLHGMWSEEDFDSSDVMVDFLLPMGFFHQMLVQKDSSISFIKQALWKELESLKIVRLQSIEFYNFECVNEQAEKVEINDESRRFSDIRPFLPMLRLVESKLVAGSRDERITNAQISVVMNKGLSELESITEPEVVDFRRNMRLKCERTNATKNQKDWLEKALSFYPPELSPSEALPERIVKSLENGLILFKVQFEDQTYKTLSVKPDIKPDDLQRLSVKKLGLSSNADKFVLKICGIQEYLLGDYPLSQFIHIRKQLPKKDGILLMLVEKDSLISMKPKPPPHIKQSSVHPSIPLSTPKELNDRLQKTGTNIFDLDIKFCIMMRKLSATNVPTEISHASLRMSIYHGNENMCKEIKICKERGLSRPETIFEEQISFDLKLNDIPRMARLCFLLYSVDKKGKRATDNKQLARKKDMLPLAWANIAIFDYKGQLRSGEYSLHMWNITMDDDLNEDCLNPIGTVESNPQKEDAICLSFNIPQFSQTCVYYPPFDKILEVAAINMKFHVETSDQILDKLKKKNRLVNEKDKHIQQLEQIVNRDPLSQMFEQEKDMVWRLREECREYYPHSLPKLLSCVSWNNHADVCIMQALLQIWTPLEATNALELLDFQYADQRVRNFAVKCISRMSDNEIGQYLLQLVQVLKYESYLECDLIDLLLDRAINNHKIGHYFFWLLRSEMHVPSVSIRFGLILEAYCRGNHQYIANLSRQVDALANLKQLAEHVKKCGNMNMEKLKDEVRKGLEKKYKQSLDNLCCPLNPAIRFKSLKIDKCKPMDSKMKPLWLVFDTFDSMEIEQFVMYKKGDDLRQDMLTIQILRIMDRIWLKKGLDFRLSIYGCLSTGLNEGLIEVVTQSRTLASIQMEFAGTVVAAFNKKCIYDWLKQQNPEEKMFRGALEEFTWSCAGYCVATYVLGVADRHSDNIMVRSTGQLFHIDFGHILGNFKSKFGVKRERVPFVLTSDFVYAINRGDDKNDTYFKEFQALCEQAFLILRKNAKFLITLFLMMTKTGIPEVSCIDDIMYLRDTLVPDLSDEEGRDHFRSRFKNALSNSWKASVNNMCRNIRRASENEKGDKPEKSSRAPSIHSN